MSSHISSSIMRLFSTKKKDSRFGNGEKFLFYTADPQTKFLLKPLYFIMSIENSHRITLKREI